MGWRSPRTAAPGSLHDAELEPCYAQGWQGHGSPVWQLCRVAAYLAGMSAKDVEIVRKLYQAFVASNSLLGASQPTVRESTEP